MTVKDSKNELISPSAGAADEKMQISIQDAEKDTETQSSVSREEFQNTKPVGRWTRWYRSPLFK